MCAVQPSAPAMILAGKPSRPRTAAFGAKPLRRATCRCPDRRQTVSKRVGKGGLHRKAREKRREKRFVRRSRARTFSNNGEGETGTFKKEIGKRNGGTKR
eukprot:4467033-Pleurochrysis_carterae.AAC.2